MVLLTIIVWQKWLILIGPNFYRLFLILSQDNLNGLGFKDCVKWEADNFDSGSNLMHTSTHWTIGLSTMNCYGNQYILDSSDFYGGLL